MNKWITKKELEWALMLRAASPFAPGTADRFPTGKVGADGRDHLTAGLALAKSLMTKSRGLLELVVDTIPVRVFWKNRESVYLGGNQLFAQDAGLNSAAELVGKSDHDMVWREQAEAYRADDQKLMASGEARFHYEEPQTTPSGRKITLLTSKVPLRDCHNQIIGVLGVYEDITEKKQAGELSRLREAALRAAANVVVITDRSGLIVWTNPAFTKETGYTAEVALGQNPRVLKSGEYPPSFYQELWKTISSGQVWHGEFHNRRRTGTC
jgi:PAS domain S-box-containing protein